MRKFVLFSVALGLSFPSESYSFAKKEGSLKNVNSTSVLLSSSAKSAVQNTVQGTVTDGKGPVSEVSVSVIGGNASTKTDAQGHFKITAAVGSKLRFSSVGYITREVPVTSNSLNVTLVDDNQTLNEVVVVGYGTQKKSNLTGAVASVNIKETMQGRPIADAGRAMQGTTPGLSIVIPSGEVGSDPTIKIRGQIGSITGSNNPLILLDNVEIPSINIVNPDDIESISVLKDAAASSIYGAKAAYGVILITTKQGAKTDQVSVNYSNNFSFQNPFKKYEMGTVDALRYSLDAA
ncbi:MAG: TonB-dependent receptor plug domain-containing protein, partial [Sphingobacterium siyangense]